VDVTVSTCDWADRFPGTRNLIVCFPGSLSCIGTETLPLRATRAER
jgi:hypothetical protein